MQQLITSIPDKEHYHQYEDYLNRDQRRYLDPHRCNRWITRTDPGEVPQPTNPGATGFLPGLILVVSTIFNFLPVGICRLLLKKINGPVVASVCLGLAMLSLIARKYTLPY